MFFLILVFIIFNKIIFVNNKSGADSGFWFQFLAALTEMYLFQYFLHGS